MPIVVDTSVALKWVLSEVASANAHALRRDCLRGREQIVAPTLLLYEATNTLYQAGRDGIVPWQSVEQGLDDIMTVVRLQVPTAEDDTDLCVRSPVPGARRMAAVRPVDCG